jgi:cytochrome c peroxidase
MIRSCFTVSMVLLGCTDGRLKLALDQRDTQPASNILANDFQFANPTGRHTTFSTLGNIDLTGPFFQSLGTNGRSCGSCHQPSDGWTIVPASVQQRFDSTQGMDPIFRTNDGSNSPNADVSTLAAKRAAYSMLLNKGLIRVGIGLPANSEFDLIAVDDPYGFASAAQLSLFRRPLPSTNLTFLSTVMWDGRETFVGQSIGFDLADQSNGATLGHAQATSSLSQTTQLAIVNFEISLFTAQKYDTDAHELDAPQQATGGAQNLSAVNFYIGINDLFGDPQTHQPFNPVVFTTYDSWSGLTGGGAQAARAAVARGQALFNGKPIVISGVSGINDEAVFGNPTQVSGTCTTCHDTPNSGNHSVAAPLNIGIADGSRRTPDMPLYTLRNKTTLETVQTTDPGRALITGKWKHISRFKGPILRALPARAPYFHNGSAATLTDVVNFYDSRFAIGFTAAEKADLIAFLRTL